jgi:hypothetical protein
VAINPSSDIVFDVARAADPEKYRAAVERLARLRAAASGDGASAPTAAQAPPAGPPLVTAERAVPVYGGPPTQSLRQLDAYGQFEAFVLQTLIQSMLPKNATTVFGKGSAGEFWKSMLAERLGHELARSGQVGIAQRLAVSGNRAAEPEADAVAGVADGPPIADSERS